jgi:3-hydroxyisobutyrate dehydrogenase
MADTKLRAGFIGLGNMGRRMASRLLEAGFPLSVYDVNTEAAAGVAARGAALCASPREVAQSCDVLLVSVPGPAETEALAFGPDGLVEAAWPGLIVVDHSTTSPLIVRKVGDALAARGAFLLDAPVSGGISGADAGTLTMLIGGDAQALKRARPVLSTMGSNLLHVGGVGAGSVCKLTHNCAVFCANLAMVECMTLAIKAGVAPDTIVEVFQKSGIGKNLDLQVSLPASLFRGKFEPRFSMKMALKDMRLATGLGKALGIPMQLAEIVEKDMAEVVERGLGDRDNNVFLTLQEERAGVQVRTTSK